MTIDLEAIHTRRQSARAPVAITDGLATPVIETLTDAFDSDPVMNWFLRSDDNRRAARRLIVEMQLAAYRANGIAIAAQDASCAALWAKPGKSADGGMGIIRQLSLLPRMMRLSGIRRLPRLVEVMDKIEKHHPKSPDHYYLFMIGVNPQHQGQGLGSSILAASLETVDRDGMPAYLENSNPKNTPLYERHGFRSKGEINLGDGNGPVLFPMWRDAPA